MGFKVLEVLMSRAASFDFGMQLHLHLKFPAALNSLLVGDLYLLTSFNKVIERRIAPFDHLFSVNRA